MKREGLVKVNGKRMEARDIRDTGDGACRSATAGYLVRKFTKGGGASREKGKRPLLTSHNRPVNALPLFPTPLPIKPTTQTAMNLQERARLRDTALNLW